MTAIRVLLSRVLDALRRSGRERRMAEEMQAHLDLLADEYAARGLSHDDARAAARRAFGGVEQIKERYRDQRGIPFIGDVRQDLAYARRLFSRERGLAALVVLTLALGISVNNTFFTVVNALCLRGLPIDRPDRVLFIDTVGKEGRAGAVSSLDLQHITAATPAFTSVAAYVSGAAVLVDEGRAADRVSGAFVSAGAFRTLGESPVLGREFVPADDRAGSPPVVLVSHALWQSRYDSDSAVVGRPTNVNGAAATIVGVMGDGFRFPGNADVWLPLGLRAEAAPDARILSVFGRLADDATLASAQAQLDGAAVRVATERSSTSPEIRLRARPINDQFNGNVRDTVWVAFLTAGALVLLVACANVGNLLLMRSATRGREMAIRASIGATRSRLVRQLLVESAMLALLAGVVGLGLSAGAVHLLAASVPAIAPLPYWVRFTFDVRVFAVLAAGCLGSVFVFGLVPAIHASKVSPNSVLKDGGRPGRSGSYLRRWTAGFLVVQLALAFVLLSNVSYILRRSSDEAAGTSIETSTLLTASFTLMSDRYGSAQQREAFLASLHHALGALPGVVESTVASHPPFSGATPRSMVIDGQTADTPSSPVSTIAVDASYFSTLGVALVQGRAFIDVDGGQGHGNAIVNRRFVERYLSTDNAIGRRLRLITPAAPDATSTWLTIVGVAPSLGENPAPLVYLPYRAALPGPAALVIRTASGDPNRLVPAVREVVRQLDSRLPLSRLMSFDDAKRASTWNGRVSSHIIETISAIALVLALVGVYSITAYSVAQRTAEIGIRMALGAAPSSAAWLVLRVALVRIAIGLTIGIGGALLWAHLFGGDSRRVRMDDLVALLPMALLVTCVAIVACVVPALRAARLDPVTALRHE